MRPIVAPVLLGESLCADQRVAPAGIESDGTGTGLKIGAQVRISKMRNVWRFSRHPATPARAFITALLCRRARAQFTPLRHSMCMQNHRRGLLCNPIKSNDKAPGTAIEQTRLIRFFYQNKVRVVEPHNCGIQNGFVKLLSRQVGGSSTQSFSGWRWFEVAATSGIQLLDQTFPGGRPPLCQHQNKTATFPPVLLLKEPSAGRRYSL